MTKTNLVFTFLKIPLDFLAVVLAAILAYTLRPYTEFIPFIQIPFVKEQLILFTNYLYFVFGAAITFIIIAATQGLYQINSASKGIREFIKVIFVTFILVITIVAFYALFKTETFFSRGVLYIMSVLTIFFSYLFRFSLNLIQSFLLKQGKGVKNVVLFGATKSRNQILTQIKKEAEYKCIYNAENFEESKLNDLDIHEIWYIKNNSNSLDEQQIITYAQINHILYKFLPDMSQTLHANVEEGMIGEFLIFTIHPTLLEGWGRIVKRIFDLVGSIILFIILSPLFILLGVLIKLDSKGDIFYSSLRVGKNRKLFKMFKFRSMVSNADDIKEQLQDKNHRKDTPLFKIKNDPRITKFGKFLRKYSIDEIPQLFNVIKGDLSLVGPRAHLPNEIKQYTNLQKRVLGFKPGITGLAQTNGRSDLEFAKENQLDLHYIVHWNFLLDLKILWDTVFVVIKGTGD